MIEAKDLHFFTSDIQRHILRGIDLKIRAGEKIGIMGKSGSGKTTLGYHLSGVHKKALVGRSEGWLTLGGKKCIDEDFPGFAGVVFQDPTTQLFCEIVRQEIALGPENMGKSPQEVEAITERLLKFLNLKRYSNASLSTLSHGLKQRVSIASMLSIQPRVLFLDEPTNFMDNPSADRLFAFLEKLNKTEGLTVLVVDHDIQRLSLWAERIIVVENGKVVVEKKAKELGEGRLLSFCPPKIPKGEGIMKVNRVSYEYEKGKPVLKDVDLEFFQGEVVALLGENGSGKTTLLKLFKGLLMPKKGEIRLANNKESLIDAVGFVFQNPDEQLFAHSVEEECAYLLKNQGLPSKEIGKRVRMALEEVGLDKMLHQLPFSLSYGEKRRLTLASVLIGTYKVICLDEPTVALDDENLDILADIFCRFACDGGTVIFSTHDLYFARKIATRFITLKVSLVG